ncbi:hypothetical protein JCM1840_007675 [Sporobolomyces johnsonii]
MSSRTATPQPWQGAATNGTGLQLPGAGGAAMAQGQTSQGKLAPQPGAGKAPAGAGAAAGRAPSAEPQAGENAKTTDVESLMDAVGASGVDLGAEEESMRATNERMHAAAMAAQHAAAAAGAPSAHTYTGVDRSRKQDFIDQQVLAECVKKVAAAFQLKTLEPDTIPLIALATRHRLMSLINASIAARDHRQSSSHFRPPPFVTASNKRRRRDALDPDLDEDEDEDEEDEMDETGGPSGSSKRPKVPAWDTLVYDDPERYLAVLERVDREEERKKRRERMLRDQKEQEERELAEAMAASAAAEKALAEEAGVSGGGGGGAEGKGKGKAKGGAERFLAANNADGPSTPGGKGSETPLGKDGKPKKERKKKAKPGAVGADGTPGSGASTPSATTIARNMTEDVKKRLTDQVAMRSLGGNKFSWLNAGVGSPTPAGAGAVGGAGGLPKPKFAPASSLPPPSFTPLGGASAGALPSTSLLNPANSSAAAAAGAASSSASAAANALTTSRLNVPPLHDAQRTQIAKDTWQAGHHVVELGDLLFALDRERGMGVGKGAGRGAALRGRAGVTRGGYRNVGGAAGAGGAGR